MALKYVFRYDGKELAVGDLSVGEISAVAKEYDIPWYQLIDAPLRDNLAAGMSLAEAAARRLGVTLPEQLSVMALTKMFVTVDDDMPKMYEDGRPLADGPTTD